MLAGGCWVVFQQCGSVECHGLAAAGIDRASPQNLRRLAASAPKSDFRSYFGACTAPPKGED